MLELFWYWFNTSANMIFYILVSIGFMIGIILMVAPDAFRGARIRVAKRSRSVRLARLQQSIRHKRRSENYRVVFVNRAICSMFEKEAPFHRRA